MIVLGVLLLVAAAVGFFLMRVARSELHAMIGAETLPVAELETLRKASDEVGGRGAFRKQCEIVGTAHPRPEGPLVAELSKTECVWYRFEVKRHYEHVTYRDGRRHVRKRKEKVAEHTSREGYAVRDAAGALIGVDPNGTSPDQPEQVLSRFEPNTPQGLSVLGIQLSLPGSSNRTIGYEYTEWAIRPGQRLYVLGEVHDRIGPLVIGDPEHEGHFVISTRSEEELRNDRAWMHTMLRIGILVAVPAGILCLVLGLVLR